MKSTLLCVLLGWLVLPAAWAGGAPRAVWTWEPDSYAMLEEVEAAEEALAFLRAKRVRIVYLYADAYGGRNLVLERPELYRRLIARFHREGLQVYALLGSAYLHTEEYMLHKRRKAAMAMFQRVLDYNAKAVPSERFDGINLDIEPHILAQWETQREQLLGQFLDMSHAFMVFKHQSGQVLEVGPAIPFWWDGIELTWRGVRKPMSEHTIDLYDYVALMDYRNRAEGPDSIISHAADEMDYASRVGKRVVIGLELTPNDLPKVTFNHLPEGDLERAIALTERAYGGRPAFAGFALHHFRGYRIWLQSQGAWPVEDAQRSD